MLARVAALKQSGVNIIVLLALSDDGHPAYHAEHAAKIAAMDCPVFGSTPDQFPDMVSQLCAAFWARRLNTADRDVGQGQSGTSHQRNVIGRGPVSQAASDHRLSSASCNISGPSST